MGLHHRKFPIYGVQFHPKLLLLTEYGHELLKNFTEICRGWWGKRKTKVYRLDSTKKAEDIS